MARHTVPTHIDLPDRVIFGLTARQMLILLIGLSLGYSTWQHLSLLSHWGVWGTGVRLALVLILFGPLTLLVAFVQLAGRPLELWAVIGLLYLATPQRYGWRNATLDQTLPAVEREARAIELDEQDDVEDEEDTEDQQERPDVDRQTWGEQMGMVSGR